VRRRIDVVGIVVALLMAAAVAVGFTLLIQKQAELRTARAAYEKCVADIPGYLDAQEILYTEQECHHG
jgi:uncharacterized membrane protein